MDTIRFPTAALSDHDRARQQIAHRARLVAIVRQDFSPQQTHGTQRCLRSKNRRQLIVFQHAILDGKRALCLECRERRERGVRIIGLDRHEDDIGLPQRRWLSNDGTRHGKGLLAGDLNPVLSKLGGPFSPRNERHIVSPTN